MSRRKNLLDYKIYCLLKGVDVKQQKSMKNFFKQLLILAVASVTLLASCSKDDDKVNAPDSIVGTAWLCETSVIKDGSEVGAGMELDFISATQVDLNIMIGGVNDNTIAIAGFTAGTYSYTYSKPNVNITIQGQSSAGVIDGNKLTITEDGEKIVFTKE
jgi:hypothetical protein